MGDDPLASTNYRTLTPIGKGGMGEVVLAEHRALGKQVVVKILHAKYAQDPRIATRTEIEARSLAALKSPFIVDVLDFGQTPEGRTFLVMEHLVGRTLGAELRARGFLPVREAIGYVIDVLSALELAHEKGIIHRDIKGDNIFLCDGSPRTVKVLDFGIAKILDVPEGISRPALPKLETEEGGFIGTPRNFAPEQALGRKVDGRTDVYSTGLLLYTLIAGQGPFAHLKAGMDLLRAHTTERPAAPSVSAKQVVPAAVDAAVLLSLEKKPADRFQSARAFADALRAVLAELPSDSDAAALEDATLV